MDRLPDDPRPDPIAPPTDTPNRPAPTTPTGTSEGARDALRHTPNQHAFDDDDEAADTDDARTYHGADDPA